MHAFDISHKFLVPGRNVIIDRLMLTLEGLNRGEIKAAKCDILRSFGKL